MKRECPVEDWWWCLDTRRREFRSEFTPAEIEAAGAVLVAAGRKPTFRAVRDYLIHHCHEYGRAALLREISQRFTADAARVNDWMRPGKLKAAAAFEAAAVALEAAGEPPKPARKPRGGVTPEQARKNRVAYQREYQRRRYAEDPEYRERRRARMRKDGAPTG